MIAIILVGGKHSLVSELYPELPIPLIPVAGKPFLYWLTKWLKNQGFNHIVYAAGHGASKITAWVQHFAAHEPSLCIDVVTESRPLGTGGAAALCASRFPATLNLIVNGDSLLLSPLQQAVKQLKTDPHLDGIIFGAEVLNAGRFGTLEMDAQHRLTAFKEKHPGLTINAGVYLLRSQLLEEVNSDKELSLESQCFPQWLAQGKNIRLINDGAPFIDIDAPDALKRAHEFIKLHQSLIMRRKEKMVAEALT